jgi:hypothetical protein
MREDGDSKIISRNIDFVLNYWKDINLNIK